MKVIGVIGKNGSGKDEVLKYLKEKNGVPFLSTGDMVREIAARQGRPSDRTTLQEISDSYFQKNGQGCFVKMVAEKIQEKGWPVAGISGVRSPHDVELSEAAGLADYALSNDGKLEDLHRAIEDLIAHKGLLKAD